MPADTPATTSKSSKESSVDVISISIPKPLNAALKKKLRRMPTRPSRSAHVAALIAADLADSTPAAA